MTIIFDSGVRTGSDVFKSIALEADAVAVGPCTYGAWQMRENTVVDM